MPNAMIDTGRSGGDGGCGRLQKVKNKIPRNQILWNVLIIEIVVSLQSTVGISMEAINDYAIEPKNPF